MKDREFTAPFNNMRTLKFKAQPTMGFHFCQSNVRRLLPASDDCRARGNQIVEHSSDNETVLGSKDGCRGSVNPKLNSHDSRSYDTFIHY